MKLLMPFFRSSKNLWFLFGVVLMLKILFFLYLTLLFEGNLFGGGNDSNYYHAYAVGNIDNAVNFWPIMLRFLNEIGLYNRGILSLVLFITSVTLTPYLYYKLVKDSDYSIKQVKAGAVFLIVYYPTIFFLTLDIYRDTFILFILLLSLLIYKTTLEVGGWKGITYFLIFLSVAFFLFLLRPYLGAALALTPFVYFIILKTKRYIKTWLFLYFMALVLAKVLGIIDPILDYRGESGFEIGGSSSGVGLINADPFMFLVYYLYSLFVQLFGIFLISFNAMLVFILESVPFIFALFYVFKNIRFVTKFASFLLVFFVIYTTVWLLGNDNLGTAIRLRMPSYLVIFACMFIVYQQKIKLGLEKINRGLS
jgi:hypothetical protein